MLKLKIKRCSKAELFDKIMKSNTRDPWSNKQMSVEIAWEQNNLVTVFHLLKLLQVVFGFGLHAFVCEYSRKKNLQCMLSYLLAISLTFSVSWRMKCHRQPSRPFFDDPRGRYLLGFEIKLLLDSNFRFFFLEYVTLPKLGTEYQHCIHIEVSSIVWLFK